MNSMHASAGRRERQVDCLRGRRGEVQLLAVSERTETELQVSGLGCEFYEDLMFRLVGCQAQGRI